MLEDIIRPYTIFPDIKMDMLSNELINDNLALNSLEDVISYDEVELYSIAVVDLPLKTRSMVHQPKPYPSTVSELIQIGEENGAVLLYEEPLVLSQTLEFGMIEFMYPKILEEFGKFNMAHLLTLLTEHSLMRIESCCNEPGLTVEVIKSNLERCYGLSSMNTKAEKKLRDKNRSQAFSSGYLSFENITELDSVESVEEACTTVSDSVDSVETVPELVSDSVEDPKMVEGLLVFDELPVVRKVNSGVLEKSVLSNNVVKNLGRSLAKKPKSKKKKKKASPFRFSMVSNYVPIGSVLEFVDNTGELYPEISCTILNDTQVEYEGKVMSLSVAADLAFISLGDKSNARQGPLYWFYNGARLTAWRTLSETK